MPSVSFNINTLDHNKDEDGKDNNKNNLSQQQRTTSVSNTPSTDTAARSSSTTTPAPSSDVGVVSSPAVIVELPTSLRLSHHHRHRRCRPGNHSSQKGEQHRYSWNHFYTHRLLPRLIPCCPPPVPTVSLSSTASSFFDNTQSEQHHSRLLGLPQRSSNRHAIMMDPSLMVTDYEQLRAMAEAQEAHEAASASHGRDDSYYSFKEEGSYDNDNDNDDNDNDNRRNNRRGGRPLLQRNTSESNLSSADLSHAFSRSWSMDTAEILRRLARGEITLSKQQWWAHSMYFFGSAFFTWLAIWDLLGNPMDADDDDDYGDDGVMGVTGLNHRIWSNILYAVVMALGPLFFFIACMMELKEASQDAKEGQDYYFGRRGRRRQQHRPSIFAKQSMEQWEVAIALTMGVAAFFDFVSAVTFVVASSKNQDNPADPSMLANHIYLVNAILALWSRYGNTSRAFRLRRNENMLLVWLPLVLGRAGDVLFFIGCLIDCIISYLPDPPGFDDDVRNDALDSTWRRAEVWAIVSAVLWWVNAILYLLADLFTEDEDEDSSSSSSSSNSSLASEQDADIQDTYERLDDRDDDEVFLDALERHHEKQTAAAAAASAASWSSSSSSSSEEDEESGQRRHRYEKHQGMLSSPQSPRKRMMLEALTSSSSKRPLYKTSTQTTLDMSSSSTSSCSSSMLIQTENTSLGQSNGKMKRRELVNTTATTTSSSFYSSSSSTIFVPNGSLDNNNPLNEPLLIAQDEETSEHPSNNNNNNNGHADELIVRNKDLGRMASV